jgi:predicted nuclease with TOPRIM domain
MTKNIENIVKIDTNSFADMCKQIIELEEENKSLKMDNDFLQRKLEQKERMLKGVKLNNSKLTLERNDLLKQVSDLKRKYDEFYEKEYLVRIEECNKLWGELFDIKHLSMWEFANKYCTEEEQAQAGKQLARELLGGA